MLAVSTPITKNTSAPLAHSDVYLVDEILIELPPEIAQPSLNPSDGYKGVSYLLELLHLHELLNAGCVDSILPQTSHNATSLLGNTFGQNHALSSGA